MFLRFKWFGVCGAAFFVGFMYELARRMQESHHATAHPLLVAFSAASGFVALGGVFALFAMGRENVGFMGLFFGFIFGGVGALLLNNPGPGPWHEASYVFPSSGDFFLVIVIALNFVLALLMVFARVPKGKMLIVNSRAFYGGDRPVFFPWMKYSVEKLDEIPVKVEFHCAAGTSVMCEAMLASNAEWCRTNGVVNVNVAHFKETAAQIVKSNICNRAEVRDVNWMSVGETLDALVSLNPATLQDTAAGVSFRCLRFIVTATTAKTAA